MFSYRKFVCFALFMAIGGLAAGGCLCGTDPFGTSGDVSDAALSFLGTLDGTVNTISSTDAATSDSSSARGKRLDIAQGQIGGGAVGWFEDLEGNRLKDANGAEYPDFPVQSDGSFNMGNLPVGVDIVFNVDVDGDGTADLQTIIHIPKDEGAETGSLKNVRTDPLSSLILAKLRRIAAAHGINLRRIGISPSGLIHRIRDAYEHLYESAGIEEEIIMNQIANLSEEDLAALFEKVIPPSVKRAMDMAEGNIQLALADDVEGVVRAVAVILLQGGFAIADDPGGVDLSFLGSLPNVKTMTFEQWDELMRQSGGPGGPGGDQELAEAMPRPEPQMFPMPTIYINQLAEVDRNFANNEDEAKGRERHGPMFGEWILSEMAELYLDGKTVSLHDLYRLLVDLEVGMGARLTYFKWNGPDQPGSDVFESADGGGIELDLRNLFKQLDQLHLGNPDPELFEQKKAQVRQMLKQFLGSTAEPSFERLFDGVLMDRVGSIEEFAEQIRGARAHLPFSRSGPATFFVVATADPFRDDSAKPVTVNIETDTDGRVTKVIYDSSGNGKFYVGFGPHSDSGMLVELIRRRTGKPLHDRRGGMLQLQLADSTIFQDVGGESFYDAFSESGVHWPGAPALRVPNHDFDPNLPPDPETNPPAFEVFVLMTQHGPDGEAVRVNYSNGVATYSQDGRYYMIFDEKTESDGTFALMTEGGELLEDTPGDWSTRVLVAASDVQGITLAAEQFSFVYGIEAPNHGYDPTGAPYYDDINDNGVHDEGEPTFDHREFLFDPNDWHSTWVERYYRRADNNGFPDPEDIDWESSTPKLRNGVELVPRNFKPRLNAFRFGRPNLTINLLAAFSPPEFFDGTHALNAETRVNPFTAIAFVNLAFDSIHNIVGKVDWDGPGPMPVHEELIEAHVFVMPIGDPVQLIAEGFRRLAQ